MRNSSPEDVSPKGRRTVKFPMCFRLTGMGEAGPAVASMWFAVQDIRVGA